MRTLVKLHLFLFLHRRVVGSITTLFSLYALVRVGSQGDGAVFWKLVIGSMGGFSATHTLLEYMGWVAVVMPILLITYLLVTDSRGLDLMMISRAGTRGKWWSAKTIALFLACIFYSAWFCLILMMVGSGFIPVTTDLREIDPGVGAVSSPWMVLFLVWLLFASGIFSISVFMQSLSLFFKQVSTAYVVIIVFLIASGQAVLYDWIPREFSPVMFPSFPIQTGSELWGAYWSAFLLNLLFAVVCYLVGLLRVRTHSGLSGEI